MRNADFGFGILDWDWEWIGVASMLLAIARRPGWAECCRSDFQVGYPDRAQGHDAAAAERYRTANGASFSEVRGLSPRASDVPHGGPCAFWEVEQPAWRREKSRACQGFHAGCIKPWIRCAFYSAYRIPHSASG